MLTFLPHIKAQKVLRCDAAQWAEMTNSAQNAEYVRLFRETGVIDWKQRLPAVNFSGFDPITLKGGAGSRKQSAMQPTGLFPLDIDHISKTMPDFTPMKLYVHVMELIKKLGLEEVVTIVLVHATPSGDGLRIVAVGRPGSTIADDQKWLAELLGVEYDACTKDLSRWSFIPLASEIYYQNDELLFGEPIKVEEVQPIHSLQEEIFPQEEIDCDPVSGRFPADYHGIPYTKIVERLNNAYGGTPQVGERHARIIKLANDLKTITDFTIDWMMELIPSFGKTRSEKRDAIQWACQHKSLGESSKLSAVLSELKGTLDVDSDIDVDSDQQLEEDETRLSENLKTMPQMPKKLPKLIELLVSKVMPFQRPAVSAMVFPALSTHISNAWFIGLENKKFRNTMMCALAGNQSVGKGCVDDPIDAVMYTISEQDKEARRLEREWASERESKKANEKGKERPKAVIRYLNSDVTPAAMLQRLYAAQNYGPVENMFTFTKVEEVEELYGMCPTQGRTRITQLIRKCWDVGKIGSERFTSAAANFETVLAWNWTACGTVEKMKNFFRSALTDGTVSRVDFATIIAPDEDFDFVYGDYDEKFMTDLAPYITNLQKYQSEVDALGRPIPLKIPQLLKLEEEMNAYIRAYSSTLENKTWKEYAWRTKLISMKKIFILYIANGCKWEDTFADFFRWSFLYSMWVKMNLFYTKATEAMENENIVADFQVRSPLDLIDTDVFSRKDFEEAVKKGRFKTAARSLLYTFRKRGVITMIDSTTFCKNQEPRH